MKKTIFVVTALFMALPFFSQEALKSIEEEYYDFLSLQGITSRPTLNYRTLSDSVWLFNVGESDSENSDENAFENGDETPLESDSENTAAPRNEQNAPDNSNENAEESIQNKTGKAKKAKTKSTSKKPLLHPWQDLNLGKNRALWQKNNPSTNFYMRGVKQGVFLKIYGPEWFNSFNTAAPYGQNDGALWQGKGYNTSLTAGARLEGYGLEITLKPQVSFSQNMGFDLVGPGVYGNEYSYFWKGNIDLPQRFGNKPFWTFDWGDTEIRYSWHTFTMGFGTQSIWLGPAWLNPMLGSNNAPSFPKFDIGLRKQRIVIPKVNWYLGDIEGRIWMGQLSESDYFDNDSSNDKRQIVGFSAAFSPSFIPGFTIGFNKICLSRWDKFSLKYLNPFYDTNNQKIPEDQKMSVTLDWIFPKIGFEVYGEIGKDDSSKSIISNPFHTVIYTVGLKKTFSFGKDKKFFGNLLFEWSNFEASQDFQMQWKYMGYYSHSGISQGYTQKGQILGAGSGYSGNSQFIGFKLYYPRGNSFLYFHRHCPDNNYIYEMTVGSSDAFSDDQNSTYQKYWAKFKTYMTIGLTTQFFILDSLSINGGLEVTPIFNNKYSNDGIDMFNFRIMLGLKYNI